MDTTLTIGEYRFRPLVLSDITSIVPIVNEYVATTTWAFSSVPREASHFERIFTAEPDAPRFIIEYNDAVIGFGYTHTYREGATFSETTTFTYWLSPEHTRRGLGSMLYELLETASKMNGKKHIIVSISSENEASIAFHEKQGFSICGRFKEIGRKFDRSFDVVWMQKTL